MTEPIQFTLPKRWLILLGTSFAVSVLLFFAAGLVAGFLLRSTPAPKAMTLIRTEKPATVAARPVSVSQVVAKPPAAAAEIGPHYPQLLLQVASFEDPVRAQSFADSLKREGFPALALGTMQLGEKTWHTVRVGPYSNWDQASRVAADLQRSYNVDVYVQMH